VERDSANADIEPVWLNLERYQLYEGSRNIITVPRKECNFYHYFWFTPITDVPDSTGTIRTISYPNPAYDYIIFDNIAAQQCYIKNYIGQTIKEFSVHILPYQLDISELPVGTYFIFSNDNQFITTFIKGGK
jgi:hypothetical protein